LRRRTAIMFKPECGRHMRRLAEAHNSVDGRRLAGDIHSHPESGRPKLSPTDKRFCNRVWRTKRNTTFVVGLDSGTGLDEWTVIGEGYEVQRKVNGHLLRIRAFAGTTDAKRIQISRDMT
jgi:hypothetical protein